MNAKYVISNNVPRDYYSSSYIHRTVSAEVQTFSKGVLWVWNTVGLHADFPVRTEMQSLQENLHDTQQDACVRVMSRDHFCEVQRKVNLPETVG